MSNHTHGEMRVAESPKDGFGVLFDLKIGSAYIAYCPGGMPEGQDKANAERLAACWNACNGIHIDILTLHERPMLGGTMFVGSVEYNKALQDRDAAQREKLLALDKLDKTILTLKQIAAGGDRLARETLTQLGVKP